jgi:hypothetical protein
VSDSESDALSESESDESARQEKALGLAKREMKGETVLSVAGKNWGAMAKVTRREAMRQMEGEIWGWPPERERVWTFAPQT